MKKIIISLIILLISFSLSAEIIDVKYRDTPVDISNGLFKEYLLQHSSVVYRIIYDKTNSYLLVKLKNTFYHYCSIPETTVNAWISSSSLGKYYLKNIKGNFDCRIYPVPSYK